MLDLFPSLRDKQESLEFLPWLVVYIVFYIVDGYSGSYGSGICYNCMVADSIVTCARQY